MKISNPKTSRNQYEITGGRLHGGLLLHRINMRIHSGKQDEGEPTVGLGEDASATAVSAVGPDAVDAEQVENYIQARLIGERIRRLRTRRSMGLVELGTRTGLSASFLSQLETGRVVPTVRNLARIALTFNKDLSYFFRDDAPLSFRTMRQGERIRLHRNNDASASFLSESMHALVKDGQLVPCIAEFTVAVTDAFFKPKIFDGMELTYVMQGTLVIQSEGELESLAAGDVVWVDGGRKRQYCCPAGSTAKAMIITRHART